MYDYYHNFFIYAQSFAFNEYRRYCRIQLVYIFADVMLSHPVIMADFDVLCGNGNEVKKYEAGDTRNDKDYHRITSISPEEWSYADVAVWLSEQGFEKYANIIAYRHKVFFMFTTEVVIVY